MAQDQYGQQINCDATDNTQLARNVDISAYAGKTLAYTSVVNDVCSPGGNFDQFFNDIAILSASGAVTQIYSPQAGLTFAMFQASNWPGKATNLRAVSESNTLAPADPTMQQATHYYQHDHLGTARLEFASHGWPVWRGEFAPFGQELDGETNSDRYRFTGKERDTESGLDYFGARYFGSSMGRFMSPDPSGLLAQKPQDPQSWNLYAYARNNPLINIDPTGLDCVYTSGSSSSVDHNSSSGECGGSEGTWVPGYVDENWVHYNGNTSMFQVGSVDGTGSSATVGYANFSEGAQTTDSGGCTSGCGGYGFASANANWLQGQLAGNSQLSGLDGYIQFLTGREEPLHGGLLNQLVSGPLDPSSDHWAGPGGMGPPGGQGHWAASVHDYNYSTNGPIKIGMYFNPTLSPAMANALIQSNSNLIRNAGGIQGVKMGMFFGVVNAFQWYANSWK